MTEKEDFSEEQKYPAEVPDESPRVPVMTSILIGCLSSTAIVALVWWFFWGRK